MSAQRVENELEVKVAMQEEERLVPRTRGQDATSDVKSVIKASVKGM